VTAEEKLIRLNKLLSETGGIAVGFSGGTDSSFLVYTAYKTLGDRAVAVTARSSTYTTAEFESAVNFTKEHGIRHVVIDSEELSIKGFSDNPPDRCYFCKGELFGKVRTVADNLGIKYVADGTNVDDLNDYRPGLKAAKELGTISPLKEAGLSKIEIRELSRQAGLSTWDKPAAACLASRFPYGAKITAQKLKMVESAETFLKNLGFKQLRVRHHGDTARIEIAPDEMKQVLNQELLSAINAGMKSIGFIYSALDLAGYRTGSMNENLEKAGKNEA